MQVLISGYNRQVNTERSMSLEGHSKGATRRHVEPKPSLVAKAKSELLHLLPRHIPRSGWLFLFLTVVTLLSSLWVVFAAYENRLAYAELRALEQQQTEYEVEWGQLLLERSTLASPNRIEQLARESLQMQAVTPEQMQVLR
ncbi:MAG: cell division protein FtsL [Oceanospirillum sp.]|nr:cell division protein FtsL [Oceanospirillum sp.]